MLNRTVVTSLQGGTASCFPDSTLQQSNGSINVSKGTPGKGPQVICTLLCSNFVRKMGLIVQISKFVCLKQIYVILCFQKHTENRARQIVKE